MPTEENNEAVDTVETLATPVAPAEDTLLPNTDSVAEAIQKARAQEKAKLYPQMERLQEELSLLKQKESEREAKDAERKAARAARDAEAAAAKKIQEEAELETKDLLLKKEQEWKQQLEQERQEREKAFALLEREREFQELSAFRQQRLEESRNDIIPELIDLISGNSKDEIEQSILGLKDRSAKILENVASVSQQSRKEMAGVSITAPASGPLDNDSAQANLSPESIANMSLAEYAKNRSKLLGNTNRGGQGLFGNN